MKALNTVKKLAVLGMAALMSTGLYTTAFAASSVKTVANNKYVIDGSSNVYTWKSVSTKAQGSLCELETDYDGNQFVDVLDGEPSNLKSTDPTVVEPVLDKTEYNDDTVYTLSLNVKKAGSATITWTDLNGTKCQIKNTVTKYTSPVKSIKVGNKDYTSLVKKTPNGKVSTGTVSGKVSVKTQKNWKVKNVRVAKYGMTMGSTNGVTKYAFSGTTSVTTKNAVNLKGGKVLEVTFYNTATKQYVSTYFGSQSALNGFNVVEE